MEKYCRAGQATHDDIIRRMRFAYCLSKATDTHSEYVIIICFYAATSSHEYASIPSHYRPEVPRGFQEVKVPRLRDNGPGWW